MMLGTCQWHGQPIRLYSRTSKKFLCSECASDHQSTLMLSDQDLIDVCRKTAAIIKEKVQSLLISEREVREKIRDNQKFKSNEQILDLVAKMDKFKKGWEVSNDARIINGEFSSATLADLEIYRFYEPNREHIFQVVESRLKFWLDCLNQVKKLTGDGPENGLIFIDDDDDALEVPTGQESFRAFEQAQHKLKNIIDRHAPDSNREQEEREQRQREELMNQKYNQCMEELRRVSAHVANKQYETALEILNRHKYPRELSAVAETIKAKLLILTKQYKKASEVLETHPKKSDNTIFLHAFAEYKQSNYNKCESIIKNVIVQNDEAKILRGDAKYHKKQLDDARNYYIFATRENPNNKLADSRLARIDICQKRYSQAQRKYEKSIKENPSNLQLRNDMAYALLYQDKIDAARSHLLRSDVNSVASKINIACVEFLQGNQAHASKLLEEHKKNWQAMLNYITMIERMKKVPQLLTYMDKFQKLFPDNTVYHERLCAIQINTTNPDQIKAAAKKLHDMIMKKQEPSTVILYATALVNLPDVDRKQCMGILLRLKDSLVTPQELVKIEHLLALLYMLKKDYVEGALPYLNRVNTKEYRNYGCIYNIAQFYYQVKNYVKAHEKLNHISMADLTEDFYRKVAYLKIMLFAQDKNYDGMEKYINTLMGQEKCPILKELQDVKKSLA